MIFSSKNLRLCRYGISFTAISFLITALYLPHANAQASHQHSAQDASPKATQSELNRSIEAANAAQSTANPSAIAEANKHLLAVALQLMGQLRLSESAYPQAAELYQASMNLQEQPGIHADLALADQLMENQDGAIQQAKLALKTQPNDPRIYITLGRAYLAKKDFADADKVLVQAQHVQPDINTLYLLAISWLNAAQPDSKKHADEIFQQMQRLSGDSGSLHVLIGRAYRDAGLMPDAIKEFQGAISLDPSTPHANYFLALAHLSTNEWKPTPEIQSEMEKEIQYHPDDFLANYMLGFMASNQHQYATADKYLKAAIALKPDWPDAYLYLGLDAYAQGDNTTAEPMLRKAVELTGSDESRANYQIRRAYVDLGRILAKAGREQEADEFAAKARDLENKVMQQTQKNTAAMLEAEGGKAGAMAGVISSDDKQETGAASLARASADATARVDAATIANSTLTPQQRQAAQTADEALRPILAQSYSDLATAEAIQKNYAQALTYYQEAEKWNPDVSDLSRNLGLAAYRAENYTEAIRGLSKALKENPDSAGIRAMLGVSYFAAKRYGDAATTFYPLGDAGMQDVAVGYAWAASLARTGDLNDASQVLERYQQLSLSSDQMVLVGQLWTEIGDYDRARAALRQVLASNPSQPKVHYAIALADIHGEKWNDAITELNAELAITPNDPDTLYNLGFVDLQQSKTDEAITLFRRVIALDPSHANAQYQLGKLLMDDGKTQEALPHLEAAAKLIPDKDYVHYQLQAAYRRLSRMADAERELAAYQDIKAKSRAQATAQINQQQQVQQKP